MMSALLNFESLLAYGIWVSINLTQVNVGRSMVRKDLQLYCMVKLWMMAKNGECASHYVDLNMLTAMLSQFSQSNVLILGVTFPFNNIFVLFYTCPCTISNICLCLCLPRDLAASLAVAGMAKLVV